MLDILFLYYEGLLQVILFYQAKIVLVEESSSSSTTSKLTPFIEEVSMKEENWEENSDFAKNQITEDKNKNEVTLNFLIKS